MAGGLFGRPFVLNVKCIIFSILCMALYLFCPHHSSQLSLYAVLFLIFVVSYVALAWYDYYYDCSLNPLQRGSLSLTGHFKPESTSKVHKQSPLEKKKAATVISLGHVLFIVPLLLYIAIWRRRASKTIYPLIMVLAIATLLYHGLDLLHHVH